MQNNQQHLAGPSSGKPLERADTAPKPNYYVAQSGCWVWQGSTSKTGYGSTRYGGRNVGAHRAYYAHYVGPIAAGQVVMHTCDHPSCVNPDHLTIGTQADNIRDRHERGRAGGWVNDGAKGSARPNAKLTEDAAQVIKARIAAGHSNKDIAADYGVTATSIWQIRKGLTWKHVEPLSSPADQETTR